MYTSIFIGFFEVFRQYFQGALYTKKTHCNTNVYKLYYNCKPLKNQRVKNQDL